MSEEIVPLKALCTSLGDYFFAGVVLCLPSATGDRVLVVGRILLDDQRFPGQFEPMPSDGFTNPDINQVFGPFAGELNARYPRSESEHLALLATIQKNPVFGSGGLTLTQTPAADL